MNAARASFLCWAVLAVVLAAPAGAQPQVKAIWEPVNYPGDYRLNDVFFVSGEVGWVSGAARGDYGGVILHTRNGGEKWEIQLGDPSSNDREFRKLHFLDPKHGWAIQYGWKLLRTSDGGQTWTDTGGVPGTWVNTLRFVSPQRGFATSGSSTSALSMTDSGGRQWRQLFNCAAQVQIQGLTRSVACYITELVFANPRVGYALGGGYNGGYSVVYRTDDGGDNWKVVFASSDIETITGGAFTDENRGVVMTRDNKVFVTEDGGQNWRGVPATLQKALETGGMRFADPSVGWACSERSCAVSTDGGQSWSTRALSLPAPLQAFSAPRRDRVFLIGNHGMVYRYRVVPAAYTAKNIHAAQLVPGYGQELAAPLARMQTKVRELHAKASGGSDALVKEPSFAQALAAIESDAGAIGQQAPAFAERYRNLGVLHIGANMLEDLKGQASGIQSGVAALKGASDLKSASAALQDILGRLDAASTAVHGGFQHLAATAAPASSGAIRNMAAGGASQESQQQPQQRQQQQPAGQPQGGQSQGGGAIEDAVKKGLQRLLKF